MTVNVGQRFDVAAIRKEFPALAQKIHGKPLAYLDSAASAQKPRAVIEAMREFMERDYANVHRSVHELATRATGRFNVSRETIRAFLNAPHTDEIVFTHGGTEALNLVASSFVAPQLSPGDEIILSEMEHHSNIVPWHMLRERQGAVIRWTPVSDDGAFMLDRFEALLSPRTKIVSVAHMSNVLGTIAPVKEIVRIAHARNIPVLLDGCQGAVHCSPDVQEIGCDFYAFTGHKLYGPTGIGVLYGKSEHLKAMRPYQGGGEMIRTVSKENVTYAAPPMRFEAGTPPIVEAIGLAAAIEWLLAQDRSAIAAHENDLLRYATKRLKELNWLRIIGDAPNKGSIVSFEIAGVHAHDAATILDSEGVAVRAGHHCAQPLMERFGVIATCRASFALYNTREEVDALIAALHRVREVFA